MKKIAFMLCMVMSMFISCTTSNDSVDYTVAQNYFHRNDAPLPQGLKISSQAEFDKQFSPAAFMGTEGEVTNIDFSRKFVIAKVLPPTDRETVLEPLKLMETSKSNLQLVYSLKTGKQQSYSTQPMFILIVDNKYKSYSIRETIKE